MNTALPTAAPRNSIFMIRITPGKYLQCRYVMATRQVLRPSGKIKQAFR
jgi:hypothetical protein